MSLARTLAFTLALGMLTPAAARADGLLIPFLGVNFGGNSGEELSNAIDAEQLNWGVSLAVMGGGILGFEADIAYSPDFFGKSDVGGSSVLSGTGNLLIGIPIGGQSGVGFRPYVLAGLGLIRANVDDDLVSLENTEGAWSFGGGAMFFFGTHVGLRGDLRYFRTFSDVDFDLSDGIERRRALDFARASAGLVLRF